jgi:hypothetical protein
LFGVRRCAPLAAVVIYVISASSSAAKMASEEPGKDDAVDPDAPTLKRGGSKLLVSPEASKFHTFVVSKPGCVMGIAFVIVMIMLPLFGGLTITLTPNCWYDVSHIVTQRNFAFQDKFDDWSKTLSGQNDEVDPERSVTLDYLTIIYEAQKGSMTAPKALAQMRKIEDEIFDTKGFEDWCLLLNSTATGSCAPFYSAVTTGAVGSFVNADGTIMDATGVDTMIDSAWCDSDGNPGPVAAGYADGKFSCDTKHATLMKSELAFGGPLSDIDVVIDGKPQKGQDFDNVRDNTGAQYLAMGEQFVLPNMAQKLKDLALEANDAGINMYFGGVNQLGGVYYGIILSYLLADQMLALGSMISVFLYLWYQLESLFLATCGFFEIFMSVPLSFSIYAILGFKYISFLQFMGIFIIMGIGADDIFVFVDAWKQVSFECRVDEC